ncbi:DUF87 domain-containing protein [Haladaptatus sp. AB618]|uniref:helicase HerA domain-containing protein n=1 Tax=Haladaptatus sp. AB618 TaxID=2934173 RepID=UPI00209BE28D|nr:DUF87 domain-containing protein [Haladaptatus sp. AB618]MCO8254529.1 DUF87 domain-containing protein [Haladaptatus sp. AB618]
MDERKTIEVTEGGVGLPTVELLTGRGFITGKSGSGKSNSASVVAEELLKNNFPLLIIDTDGEYYGLKEQFEILHVGADEECDIQVGIEHAERIAELALEQNIPIILDVSAYLDEEEAKGLIKETAHHLFSKEKKLKKPFLIIIEEVHEYIPESVGLDECGQMLIKVAKRGRKHGLGLCGISQRPADVKKDFITQCDWLVWHRLTWKNDTGVVRRVLGTEYSDVIQDLDDGEAFLMTDWNDEIQQVRFRRKETFDAGATPDLDDFERPELKSVSTNIVEELKEISERKREQETRLDRLEEELDRKTSQVQKLESELEQARDMSELAQQFTDAITQAENGDSQDLQATVEEIREEKNKEIRELRAENRELKEEKDILRERVNELEKFADTTERFEELQNNFTEAVEAYARLGDALGLSSTEEMQDAAENSLISTNAEIDSTISTTTVETTPEEFIEDEAVQAEIEVAKGKASSPRYVKGVVASVLQSQEPVTYEEIADHLEISTTSHVATAVNALHEQGIVSKSKRGRETIVDLRIEDLEEIRAAAKRREKTKQIMEEI